MITPSSSPKITRIIVLTDLLSSSTVEQRINTALGKMTNPTEYAALELTIFC